MRVYGKDAHEQMRRHVYETPCEGYKTAHWDERPGVVTNKVPN